ncbi:MAG TPA: tRNA pseudouridine(55) synthase TruB [Candidatus Kryptonia bacterium]|nr:tRNA pseudouridine(55) synthase TruB [Candidatus Kryptonia bacterium]
MDGILIVDKPEGVTSADVVRIAKRALRVKVGHLGTLDPFATGVLPLCLGAGTKIAQFLNVADKTYAGVIQLGGETDTGDKTGRVVCEAAVPKLRLEDLDALAQRLRGEQLQTPPMYSAIKQDGVPLYKLARQGEEVDREPRRVIIHRLSLRLSGRDTIAFEVHCSKGTYVRVLAQDIGVALRTVAHLATLRRTAFGAFTLRDAASIDDLRDGRVATVIGLRAALGHLREIEVDHEIVQLARRGQQAALRALPAPAADESVKLIGPGGELVAVISTTADRRWQFARVFAAQSA